MAELLLVTCGAPDPGLVALAEAARARGLATSTVDASEGFPHFDARPASELAGTVASLQSACRRADGLVLAVPARPSGCPGAVLNLLQLLGGAVYDSDERASPLAGRPVLLRATGDLAHAALALEQLREAVTSLGGVPVGASLARQDDGQATWAEALLGVLLRGPRVATMPPPVDLGLGHVHLPQPPPVADALRRAGHGVSLYAPRRGLAQLRRAVGRRLGLEREGRDVLVTVGASGALAATLGAHLRAGAAVLVPDPGFPNYRTLVEARGLRAVPYRLRPELGFLPDLDELAASAAGARAILWNFPHNPTGAVAPRPLVEGLVALADEHDLLVVSDEVYADLVWDGEEHLSPSRLGGWSRTVVVGSCSKTFAMAGHRIGWAVAPAGLLEDVVRVHWAEHMSPPTGGQAAAVAALEAVDDLLPPLRARLLESREAALRTLDGTGLVDHRPGGAFYLWLNIGAARASPADYAVGLVDEERVTLMPGDAFGQWGRDRVRLSFAAPPESVRSGCQRLRAYHARRAGAGASAAPADAARHAV